MPTLADVINSKIKSNSRLREEYPDGFDPDSITYRFFSSVDEDAYKTLKQAYDNGGFIEINGRKIAPEAKDVASRDLDLILNQITSQYETLSDALESVAPGWLSREATQLGDDLLLCAGDITEGVETVSKLVKDGFNYVDNKTGNRISAYAIKLDDIAGKGMDYFGEILNRPGVKKAIVVGGYVIVIAAGTVGVLSSQGCGGGGGIPRSEPYDIESDQSDVHATAGVPVEVTGEVEPDVTRVDIDYNNDGIPDASANTSQEVDPETGNRTYSVTFTPEGAARHYESAVLAKGNSTAATNAATFNLYVNKAPPAGGNAVAADTTFGSDGVVKVGYDRWDYVVNQDTEDDAKMARLEQMRNSQVGQYIGSLDEVTQDNVDQVTGDNNDNTGDNTLVRFWKDGDQYKAAVLKSVIDVADLDGEPPVPVDNVGYQGVGVKGQEVTVVFHNISQDLYDASQTELTSGL